MLQVSDWLVVVGTVSIAHNSPGKRYRALQILYHPRFNSYNNDYDVGLLRTIADMDMSSKKEMAPSVDRAEENMHCTFSPTKYI